MRNIGGRMLLNTTVPALQQWADGTPHFGLLHQAHFADQPKAQWLHSLVADLERSGAAVRQGLLAAMQQAQADAAVAAVLLVGAGKAFIAGADIREFGKPPVAPILPEVCRAIENLNKPVVAVLHGAALGGGLEVALSAHYRLALPAATLGLPEVNLGLLPGSGGTQRAPRLMGVQAATTLMLSGQPLKAQAALQAGLMDKLVEDTARREGFVRLLSLHLEAGQLAGVPTARPALLPAAATIITPAAAISTTAAW